MDVDRSAAIPYATICAFDRVSRHRAHLHRAAIEAARDAVEGRAYPQSNPIPSNQSIPIATNSYELIRCVPASMTSPPQRCELRHVSAPPMHQPTTPTLVHPSERRCNAAPRMSFTAPSQSRPDMRWPAVSWSTATLPRYLVRCRHGERRRAGVARAMPRDAASRRTGQGTRQQSRARRTCPWCSPCAG